LQLVAYQEEHSRASNPERFLSGIPLGDPVQPEVIFRKKTGQLHQDRNNNNNIQGDIYSAVITNTRSLREFTRFIWWI